MQNLDTNTLGNTACILFKSKLHVLSILHNLHYIHEYFLYCLRCVCNIELFHKIICSSVFDCRDFELVFRVLSLKSKNGCIVKLLLCLSVTAFLLVNYGT